MLRELFAGDEDVRLLGPMRAGVFKIRGQFRFEMICYCPRPGHVQGVLAEHMPSLNSQLHAEVIADADPVNLL